MKLSVAPLPTLLTLGLGASLKERPVSTLEERANCEDPQYYCRYGFCCNYAQTCDVGGCDGGDSGKNRCSGQGQICAGESEYSCCGGLTCKGAGPVREGLCAGPDGSTEPPMWDPEQYQNIGGSWM